MKCVIIAAGMGSRLRSVAPSKPLAPVKGVPLIERIARSAKAGGASAFVVVTGYEAGGIEAFLPGLAERIGAPVEAARNSEWEKPNGISVLAAEPALNGEFLLLMSDHLFDPAIVRTILAANMDSSALLLGADFRLENPLVDLDDVTKIAVGQERRIAAIGKTIPHWDAFDTGVFRATTDLFAAIRKSVSLGGLGSLSEGVQLLADEGRAQILDIGDTWWIDVDDEAAMAKAEETLPPVLA